MSEARFQYKCRLCGEIYTDACSGEDVAQHTLICTVHGYDMPQKYIGIQPQMFDLHSGCKAGYGVGDLLGYIVAEEDR